MAGTTKSGRTRPTPLVIFFHGGGFRGGDKARSPRRWCSSASMQGFRLASANYRLSQTAPFPGPMLDGCAGSPVCPKECCRAGNRSGPHRCLRQLGGAGIALWVGFHDDLADPASADPIARESSRVTCLATDGAQTSYDPRFIKALIGGRAHEHSALRSFFGITSDADSESPRAHKLLRRGISPELRHGRRPAGFLVLCRTRRYHLPLMPNRARGSITHSSAGRSRPSSTQSASNASSAIATIIPRKMIPPKTCAANMTSFFKRDFDRSAKHLGRSTQLNV